MMKMYSGFMRIFYITLCVLIATPSASFCGWQQMARALGTKLLKHAEKFAVVWAFNYQYARSCKRVEHECLEQFNNAQPCEDVFPRVRTCAKEICQELGVDPEIRFHDGPDCSNAIPKPTIYLNRAMACKSEAALRDSSLKTERMDEKTCKQIAYLKVIMYHEAGHIKERHGEAYARFRSICPWVNTGVYLALRSFHISRVIPFVARPYRATIFSVLGCWHAGMIVSQRLCSGYCRRQETRADDVIPATKEMLLGAKKLFKPQEPYGPYSIWQQFSSHPINRERLSRLEKRCEHAAVKL